MRFINQFAPILPELFLAIAIQFLLFLVVYLRIDSVDSQGKILYPLLTRIMTHATYVVLFITLLLLSYAPMQYNLFGNIYFSAYYIYFAKIFVLIVSLAVVPIIKYYLTINRMQGFEIQLLFLIAVFAFFVLPGVNDFLFFFIVLELQSLCAYILAASRRTRLLSIEAGLKYFILGSLSSGLLLFGIALLYGLLGTTNFIECSYLLLDVDVLGVAVVAFVFIFSGIFFKIAIAPFHIWSPDVYEGAPLPIVAVFSTLPKVSYFVVLCRFLFLFIGQPLVLSSMYVFLYVLSVLGLLSVIIGVLGALYQTKIKRLVAYSGISNVGYVLISLSSNTAYSTSASFFYLIIYIVLTLNLFYIVVLVRGSKSLTYIVELQGLARKHPFLGFILALNMFSYAGVPPLAGFFGKFVLINGILQSSGVSALLLMLLFSVISAVYYIRIVKIMYFDKSDMQMLDLDVCASLYIFLVLTTLFNIFFLFVFDILWSIILLLF